MCLIFFICLVGDIQNEVNNAEKDEPVKKKRKSMYVNYEELNPPPFMEEKEVGFCIRFMDDRDVIVCTVCRKVLSGKSKFIRHKKKHDIPKLHVCNLCNQSFWTRKSFSKHMMNKKCL